MARNINEIKDLARHAVKGTAPADVSASTEEINSIVKEEIRALASDFNTYRRNKYDIFEIIQEAADIFVDCGDIETIKNHTKFSTEDFF